MKRSSLVAALAAALSLLFGTVAHAASVKPQVNYAGFLQPLKGGDALWDGTNPFALIHGTPTAGDCALFYDATHLEDAGISGCGSPPGGSSNQIQYNNGGAFGGFTMGGDCTLVVGTGTITCTKLNGVSPGYFYSGLDASHLTAAALANGMTGTTQTASDNTTKLATDAFVQTVVGNNVANYLPLTGGSLSGLLTMNGGAVTTPECPAAKFEVGYLGLPDEADETSNFTLACTDEGQTVPYNSASAGTATVPPHSSVALPNGYMVGFSVKGAGALTLTQGAGVTFQWVGSAGSGNMTLLTGAGVVIQQTATADTWRIWVTSTGGSAGGASVGGVGAGAGVPQGRITLTTGTPEMSGDCLGCATIYYDCSKAGKGVSYYNGSGDATDGITSCEELTVWNSTQEHASDLFDLAYYHPCACIVTVTSGSGLGWAGDTSGSLTARGTGYSAVHNARGYWTFGPSTTINYCYNGSTNECSGGVSGELLTYLGTCYSTAAGQTSMQFHAAGASGGANPFLGCFNAYNRTHVYSTNIESASWTYTTNAGRKMNNSASDRVTWVDGLGVSPVGAVFKIATRNTGAGFNNSQVVVEDSATWSGSTGGYGAYTNDAGCISEADATQSVPITCTAATSFSPKIGLHYAQMLESNNGGGSWTMGYFGGVPLRIDLDD